MSDNDLTLPGDLPGLLRRGSPVVVADRDSANIPYNLRGRGGTVHAVAPSNLGMPLASMALDNIEHVIVAGLNVLFLDLTDPTGRWHAWLWLNAQGYDTSRIRLERVTLGAICDARNAALRGHDMTDEQIAILRDLALTVAGRLP